MEVRNVHREPKEVMTLQDRLDDMARRIERLEKIVSRLEQDVSMLKNPWL
jgi:TolA-binding protein